ncbi:hypothetical protein [Methylobacterium sp. WL116]|uniref:hypothetical protein n=1 Tax=Methylobacterium sp. WL116 TaxID=2603889 RepID=UPI0011C7991F|nr:hypothetical protein [Methylobacterium sp. WL116]TXM94261.1 hypothetical protein FV223_05305 [Methylobacterium sp. WL116]
MDDTHALRQQLTQAWRVTLEAALDRGTPEQPLVETMAEVAQARLAASFGPAAAASYLQLLAEGLRDVDRKETTLLVRGDDPAQDATVADLSLDPDWLVRDDLLD